MRICLINLDFAPYRSSGLTIYGEKLARGISKKYETTVITSHRGEKREEHSNNIRLIRIPISALDKTRWIDFSYKASKLVLELDKKEEFDLIHFIDVHFGYSSYIPFVATLHQSFNQRLKAMGNLPYHSSFSNLVMRYFYYKFATRLERNALKKSIKLISVSNATKKEFVKEYKIKSSKIDVIHSGIDTNFFKPRKVDELKERLHLENEKILLYVGFTTPRKGIEYVAGALKKLDENVKLMIVGKWEKGYREKFYNYLGRDRKKIIEVGYVEDDEMPNYYSIADIFVLPSLLEGFGFPLVEAMACETPVIATKVGSIPEVVGDCGILVKSMSSSELAVALDTLLRDEKLRKKMGRKGRKRVEKYFDEKLMISKTMNFYETL
jgi:glycosyltransferase involved in cell wall biosynthesis